eukprot:517979-Amorphochlora_amoeboformis.AAC.1
MGGENRREKVRKDVQVRNDVQFTTVQRGNLKTPCDTRQYPYVLLIGCSPGFKSRCTIPLLWIWWTASTISARNAHTSFSGNSRDIR